MQKQNLEPHPVLSSQAGQTSFTLNQIATACIVGALKKTSKLGALGQSTGPWASEVIG
jgi:hypothetical protein